MALSHSFQIQVIERALTLNFVAHARAASVSAIEMTPLYPNPAPPPSILKLIKLGGYGGQRQGPGSAWRRIGD
jgi:hypothetical protein